MHSKLIYVNVIGPMELGHSKIGFLLLTRGDGENTYSFKQGRAK